MGYTRCKTCGKYIEPSSAQREFFCSEACAASFARCTNCGRYFPAGAGYDGEICSRACSIRYTIHRSHGAQPAGTKNEDQE